MKSSIWIGEYIFLRAPQYNGADDHKAGPEDSLIRGLFFWFPPMAVPITDPGPHSAPITARLAAAVAPQPIRAWLPASRPAARRQFAFMSELPHEIKSDEMAGRPDIADWYVRALPPGIPGCNPCHGCKRDARAYRLSAKPH
jgi:hypothetical protein